MKIFANKQSTKQTMFGPSKKSKNTYILKLSNLMTTPGLFKMCNSTPLPIMVKNGVKTQSETGWMAATNFPNPCATNMHIEYQSIVPYMGEKIASTVIEYLDKETGKPVLMLFPTSIYVFDEYQNNYMSHLNHATRQDLAYQVKIREQMIDTYLRAKQK